MQIIATRLLQARLRIILTSPFFGSLLMRLPLVPDVSVPTFRTNGRLIQYNPDYAAQLSDPELRGVMIHEVLHCAMGHLWRMEQRDLETWNRAADYSVNGMLAKYTDEQRQLAEAANGRAGFIPPWEVPSNFLLDPALSELSTEEIYHRLSKPTPPSPQQGGSSQPQNSGASSSIPQPGTGHPSPPSGAPSGNSSPSSPGTPSCGEFVAPVEDEAGEAPLEAEWQIAVTQAATVAKMAGALPGSLQRLIGDLLTPRVPWREVLREFIRQRTRDDYSFTRPNRRYTSRGVILPSLHSERMGRLAIGVDTSGSITDRILAEFQAEIQAALDECQPESIEVIYCDAAVRGSQEFTPGDTVRLEAKGGGGTAFAPVFDHLAKQEEEPVACIYLTDGCGPMPAREPDFPVLWASTDRTNFPFGQVVAVR